MLFGFLAGILSILSPCVLPLLPIVLAGAVAEHWFGPLALALGVATSFTAIGLFVATIGLAIGFDLTFFRYLAAVLLIGLGVVLLVPRMQMQLATASGPMSNWTQNKFSELSTGGFGGQLSVGLLLGAIWTPCVGPTLGAASMMAARGENLASVALTMLSFGVGAATLLLLLAALSRELLVRWRGKMLKASSGLKMVVGALLVIAGVLTLTGYDRAVQTSVENFLPSWAISLATIF